MERFWFEAPGDLFKRVSLLPHEDDTWEEKLNSITRLILVISLILFVLKYKHWFIFLLIGLVVVIFLYYMRKNNELIEHFDDFMREYDTLERIRPRISRMRNYNRIYDSEPMVFGGRFYRDSGFRNFYDERFPEPKEKVCHSKEYFEEDSFESMSSSNKHAHKKKQPIEQSITHVEQTLDTEDLKNLYTHIVGQTVSIEQIQPKEEPKPIRGRSIFRPRNSKRKTAYDLAKEKATEDSELLQKDLVHKYGYESNL